jgi:uncharacterized membrane protein YjjP (DUF1212 family)
MEDQMDDEIKRIGAMLLRVGTLLLSAGASTHRTRNTVSRLSQAFGFTTELMITNRAITLSISDKNNEHIFNTLKRISGHGVNFKIVSGISRMSWKVNEQNSDLEWINHELDRLSALPHYPRLLVLVLVGLAGASFCRIFEGSFVEMIITFFATFSGLFIRQEAIKKELNPLLCVFFAAFTSTFIVGLFWMSGVSDTMEHAFTACVLFLIPGVPLINSFSDLIDGNIVNGIVRGMNGLLIAFAIALGLLATMLIFNL